MTLEQFSVEQSIYLKQCAEYSVMNIQIIVPCVRSDFCDIKSINL